MRVSIPRPNEPSRFAGWRPVLVAASALLLSAVAPGGAHAADPDQVRGLGVSYEYTYEELTPSRDIALNVGSGNLVIREDDSALPNTASHARIQRYFNSLSPRVGEVGARWSLDAPTDVRLRFPTSARVVVATASGYDQLFIRQPDNSWAPERAGAGSLVEESAGWRATTSDGISYTFDSYGRAKTAILVGDDTLTYNLTSAGGQDRLSSITNPGNTQSAFSRDGSGRTIEVDDPSSNHYYYDYDAAGLLTGYRDQTAAATTTYSYAAGKLSSVLWPNGDSASFTLDANGRLTESLIDADDTTTVLSASYSAPGIACPPASTSQTTVTKDGNEPVIYCVASDATILKVIYADTTAPDVRADGDLTDDGLIVAGTREDEVNAYASDNAAGVETLRLMRGSQELSRVDFACDVSFGTVQRCPLNVADGLPFDASDLPTGKSTLTVTATDASGNTGTSAPRDIVVDRVAPASVGTFDADYDADADQTTLYWDVPDDPDQSDGSAGSGVDTYRYRYNRTGTWSTWRTTDDIGVDLAGGDVGDDIDLQIVAIDAVGNESPVANKSATVAIPEDGVLTGEDDADEPFGEDEPSARRAEPVKVVCTPTISDPIQFGIGGDPNNAVRGSVLMRCRPGNPQPASAVAATRATIFLRVCVQYSRNGGPAAELDCKNHKMSGTKLAAPGVSGGAAELCRPGTVAYRVWTKAVRAKVPGLQTASLPASWGASENYACNEAGAFRRLATRGARTAERQLDIALNATGSQQDPTPQQGASGARNLGWSPHHIVPAGEGTRERETINSATEAQARAYSCNIRPNEAANGVWLRGSRLASDTSAFKNMTDPALKARSYHVSLHTNAYYETVNRALAQHGTTSQCGSSTGMRGALNQLKGRLKNGTLTGRG